MIVECLVCHNQWDNDTGVCESCGARDWRRADDHSRHVERLAALSPSAPPAWGAPERHHSWCTVAHPGAVCNCGWLAELERREASRVA